jgi:UDP-2-acetamido-3-amino-2,3-dideoxy-glucuronate N-acetyltransferase
MNKSHMSVILWWNGEKLSLSSSEGLVLELIRVNSKVEERGSLSSVEFGELPFTPLRVFWISQVPAKLARGNHFHKKCNQILICTDGEISISTIDKVGAKRRFALSSDDALILPKFHYVEMVFHNPESKLLVLADQPYDISDTFAIDELKD